MVSKKQMGTPKEMIKFAVSPISFFHVILGKGAPSARQGNSTLCPSVTSLFEGFSSQDGGTKIRTFSVKNRPEFPPLNSHLACIKNTEREREGKKKKRVKNRSNSWYLQTSFQVQHKLKVGIFSCTVSHWRDDSDEKGPSCVQLKFGLFFVYAAAGFVYARRATF